MRKQMTFALLAGTLLITTFAIAQEGALNVVAADGTTPLAGKIRILPVAAAADKSAMVGQNAAQPSGWVEIGRDGQATFARGFGLAAGAPAQGYCVEVKKKPDNTLLYAKVATLAGKLTENQELGTTPIAGCEFPAA